MNPVLSLHTYFDDDFGWYLVAAYSQEYARSLIESELKDSFDADYIRNHVHWFGSTVMRDFHHGNVIILST